MKLFIKKYILFVLVVCICVFSFITFMQLYSIKLPQFQRTRERYKPTVHKSLDSVHHLIYAPRTTRSYGLNPHATTTQARPFPSWRGPGGYYGHYHEELDVHRTGGFRQLRSHRVLVNDDDIGKHEYMRAVPSLVDKLPVEFPVLH